MSENKGSQSGTGRGWWWNWWFLGLLLVWGLVWIGVNLVYIRQGVFAPDFAIIARAFRFNFELMPLASLIVGLLIGGGAILGEGRSPRFWGLLSGLLVIAVGGGLLGLRHYVTEIEPKRLVIREVQFWSPHVTEALRIVHVSDIQSGGIGAFEEEIIRQIGVLDPDIIINTGDWVQPLPPFTVESEIPKLVELFGQLSPPVGFFSAYGDTDGPLYEMPADALKPVTMLGVRPFLIEWDGGFIALQGLGLFPSRYRETGVDTIEGWISGVPEGALSVLVGHAPDFILEAAAFPIDLCLAGHTHGGQIRLPFLGPLVLESEVPKSMSRGFMEIGATRASISSGVGSTHAGGLPNLRFMCPPELVLIEVLPAAGGGYAKPQR